MVSYRRPLLVIFLLLSACYIPDAIATHSVSADPSGGTFSSTQSVILTATINSTIYYTLDGTDPTNSSTVYTSPIEIATNTILKFLAVDQSDNHTTDIVAENYIFDTVAPTVVETGPTDGQRAVDVNTVINVTFSKSMDESTINADTFIVESTEGLEYFGFTTYDADSNTATFFPDLLDESFTYVVTLKEEIADLAGNSLSEDHIFTFTTGPDMGIKLFEHDPSGSLSLLGGSSFTITPDPFTLSDSLTVDDNQFPDVDPNDGSFFLNNIEFGTFIVSETGVPSGFGNIFDNLTITAHETLLFPRAEFKNRNVTIPLNEFPPEILVGIPPPDLTSDQFELYRDSTQVGTFLGFRGGLSDVDSVSTVGPGEIPIGTLETLQTLEHPETILSSVLFDISASPGTPAQELFTDFMIPTYPDIDPSIKNDTFYFVPAFIIPYGDSGNNIVLTPTIGHIRPGMTLVLEQPSYIESEEVKVERVNMTFNAAGNNIGFSFAITDERPPGTSEPPVDIPALFLDVDFIGNIDFSSPSAFESSPVIDILVNKTLPEFDELPDGCVDFQLLLFNENAEEWEVVDQLRDPTQDTETQCGFTVFPEHFSKFAVGGVKGQTISTESDNERDRGGGGGGSRSTAVTQTLSGDNVEKVVRTNTGEVLIHFESIDSGSGQLKVNSNELSSFREYFDELAYLKQDSDEHGITKIEGLTYSTVGYIFDIDASAVEYEGKIEVTIPYDENTVSLFAQESDVRFIHYNEELGMWEDMTKSVSIEDNTVTGELRSLSPVASAIILDSGSGNAEASLEDNLMQRVKAAEPSFSLSNNGQVEVAMELENVYSDDQEYVVLVQVVDHNNIVQSIDLLTGSLETGKGSTLSMHWQNMTRGLYEVQVIILSELENPHFLSRVIHSQLSI